MSLAVIASRNNALVRALRLAAVQARRSPAGLVVAEGIRVIEEALRAGSALEGVLILESFGNSAREQALLASMAAKNIAVHRAAASLMNGISDVVTPQGAIALVRVPAPTLATVRLPAKPLVLFLCGIRDPGNLGTLLRTARAAGVALVGLAAESVSARNPKVIRASAGAFFHLPPVEGLDPEEICAYCKRRGLDLYQTSARSARACWRVDFRGPTAFLLGNEARGLDESDWRNVPSLRIPMASGVESLNVAIAGAALLFEAFRQRSEVSAAARTGA
jgi:TrmH family RNA methyltransferase